MSGEDFCPFDRDWLDPILEAIGGFEGDAHGVRLDFETGQPVTATILHGAGSETVRTLNSWGIAEIAKALNIPYPAQQITLSVARGEFAIMECRLIPKNVSAKMIADALKRTEGIFAV